MKDNVLLRTENMSRKYVISDRRETEIEVLKDINLEIREQEFISIMGKSGSGKTTLLKLLGLIDRPTSGKLYFKGVDSEELRGDRLARIRRQDMGFVYQDYYLLDSLSVFENIMLPMILDHKDDKEKRKNWRFLFKSKIFWENIHMNYPEERNRERLSAEHW